jgi:hypothetical protein
MVLEAGHFALDEQPDAIADHIAALGQQLVRGEQPGPVPERGPPPVLSRRRP